jgi:DNA mismatch repair protein MutS2
LIGQIRQGFFGKVQVNLPVHEIGGPAGNERRRQGGAAPVTLERKTDGQALEIDLRGRTVEEAVDEVDRTLDGLVVSGGTWLRVIHGKGTGALRQAIADQLQEDPRVKSHRLGEPAEGGSGVTIVVLK